MRSRDGGSSQACVSAGEWGNSFPAPPVVCSRMNGWRGALMRRWRDTPAEMEQPRLDHHYVVLHLGGPKRITRRRDGPQIMVETQAAAITSVPAGTSHNWSTQGPIGFAHLYLAPALVDRTVQERFDVDPRTVELTGRVGTESPLLAALFMGMLAELETPAFSSRLMLDTLLQSFLVQLIREHSSIGGASRTALHSLAPRKLRRVLDFIEANLADDLELDDLASVAGSSRFHFSRAFRDATGFPPYRYLVHRRIDAAKTLLVQGNLSIEQVAADCGFKSTAQFSVMFKQIFGTTPSRFRQEH